MDMINTRLVSELLESEDSLENSADSPRSADTKIASTSSSRRSRRGSMQKRVVSIPIKDVEGSKMKGDHITAPPADSWAWRKYGQKPIKGSPYPRGYYRCSSSRGCPARKQVERSRVDPNMLVVTYSCEHNHPWPPSSRHHNKSSTFAAAPPNKNTTSAFEEEHEEDEDKKPINLISHQSKEIKIPAEDKFSNFCEGPLIHGTEFGWLPDFDSTFCTMLESSISTVDKGTTDNDIAMIFTMQDEDESLFADLGELPECSAVFRRWVAQKEAEQLRHSTDDTMCLSQICQPS